MDELIQNAIFRRIEEKLAANSVDLDGNNCRLWTGYQMGKNIRVRYGQTRFKLPYDDFSKLYYVHRLSYMARTQNIQIPPGLHVSHLCHRSLCVNPDHLSLEPAAVNVQRQQCGDVCTGHKMGDMEFPACILW